MTFSLLCILCTVCLEESNSGVGTRWSYKQYKGTLELAFVALRHLDGIDDRSSTRLDLRPRQIMERLSSVPLTTQRLVHRAFVLLSRRVGEGNAFDAEHLRLLVRLLVDYHMFQVRV